MQKSVKTDISEAITPTPVIDSRKIDLVMLFKFAIGINLLSSINFKIIAENAGIGKN